MVLNLNKSGVCDEIFCLNQSIKFVEAKLDSYHLVLILVVVDVKQQNALSNKNTQ